MRYSGCVSFLLLTSAVIAFGGTPQIRFADAPPFAANGSRVPSVWAKADRLVRFTRVIDFGVALDPSEARVLFDRRNLYVALRGSFDAKQGMTPGAKDNFEFFIQPDLDKPAYFHVIVAASGKLYVETSGGEVKESGVKSAVRTGTGEWTADLTIPFQAIGMVAPAQDRPVRIAVMRNNTCVDPNLRLGGKTRCEASSWTPNKYDYGDPSKWGDAVMTRTFGVARDVESEDLGCRVNLLANSEFDVPGRGWSFDGGAIRRETLPMSRQWVCAVSGKAYFFLTARPYGWTADADYTLAVRARSTGSEPCALQVVVMVKDAAGRTHEGTYVTGNLALGSDFHEYYLPFRTPPSSKGVPAELVFYKIGSKAPECALEIDAVRMYAGRVSSFEIRRSTGSGRRQTVPGTEAMPKPNPWGPLSRPLRALTLATRGSRLREALELFAGTGVQVDVLELTGKAQDVYLTRSYPSDVERRLADSAYGVYLIPRDGEAGIGPELASRIKANARKGAGVYRAPAGCKCHDYLIRRAGVRYGVDDFPYGDYDRPAILREVLRAAFGEPAVPVGAEVVTNVAIYGGVRFVSRRTVGRDGRTADWTFSEEPVTGPRLGAFTDDGTELSVAVVDGTGWERVEWSFEDCLGRELARGSGREEKKLVFTVPRERLHSNLGIVRLTLQGPSATLDRRTESVCVKENDTRRLLDDFTPSIWPFNDNTSYESYPQALAQLEKLGIRATMMPVTSGNCPALIQRAGFGTGGDFLATGAIIADRQESPIRKPAINDPTVRADMAKTAYERAAATAGSGLVQGTLYDEPGLTGHGTAAEPDANPGNITEYRVRMRAKYGTIDEYNRRHETRHASFDALSPAYLAEARKTGKLAEYVEWRTFNVDRWCEVISNLTASAHRADPALKISLCNSFGQHAFSGNDYWKLLTKTGLGFSNEYTAMVYFGRAPIFNFDEFYRSFRPDMRVWGFTGYYYTTERMRFMPWWFAAHRYGGFTWYAAGPRDFSVLDPVTYAWTVDARELQASLADTRLLDGLGKVLTTWAWAPRNVSIYYSHESMLVSTALGAEKRGGEVCESGPLHDFMHSRQGAQYLVEELLYQHDFVSTEQIVTGALATNGCRVLFMPRIIAMSDAEVRSVKAFLAGGGRALADELPGSYDELGVKRRRNPFKDVTGMTVLGRNFDERDISQRRATLELLRAASAVPALCADGIEGRFGREAMHYVSGETDVYVVLRMLGRSQDSDAETFRFARKGFAYDVRTGAFLGETDRVVMKVPVADAAVFAVLPQKLNALDVTLPDAVTCGDDLRVRVAIVGGDARADSVVQMSFVAPSGKCPPLMRRNVVAKNGRIDMTFPTAFNDETGIWKVRVREPLTGMTVEKSVVVRPLPPTEVMIFCDTEDFTSDLSHDAARDLANLFTEEGVRAHFAVVGYLARQWSRLGRSDVCEALRPHVIGCHTLKHSVPPDIIERADVADAEEALARTFGDEAQAFDLIEQALGKRPIFGVPPGISKTCEAMYAYAKMGAANYCDTVVTDGKDGALWYANVRQFPYFYDFMIEDMLPGEGPEPDYGRILDSIARHRRVILFEHPNKIVHTRFWDSINYRWGNNSAWGKWKSAPVRPAADVALYLRRQRELIRRLRADPRIVLTDLEKVCYGETRQRVPIARTDVPFLRERLGTRLACVRDPSWCVADIFQAAVRFLRGATRHDPGSVHGFAASPQGVKMPVWILSADVRKAAGLLDLDGFIPPVIHVGSVDLGPADFLFAALDVLVDESAESVMVVPRNQLGDIRNYPKLANFKPDDPGFSKSFKDRYVSERLKLQFWTLRYE